MYHTEKKKVNQCKIWEVTVDKNVNYSIVITSIALKQQRNSLSSTLNKLL